jgi:hypothetical protein
MKAKKKLPAKKKQAKKAKANKKAVPAKVKKKPVKKAGKKAKPVAKKKAVAKKAVPARKKPTPKLKVAKKPAPKLKPAPKKNPAPKAKTPAPKAKKPAPKPSKKPSRQPLPQIAIDFEAVETIEVQAIDETKEETGEQFEGYIGGEVNPDFIITDLDDEIVGLEDGDAGGGEDET